MPIDSSSYLVGMTKRATDEAVHHIFHVEETETSITNVIDSSPAWNGRVISCPREARREAPSAHEVCVLRTFIRTFT